MKYKLFFAFVTAVLLGACGNNMHRAADPAIYEVKGSLKNVSDSTFLMLFSLKDYTANMIAVDTVQDGCFYFKVTPESNATERYMLLSVGNVNISPLGLHFWAAAGDCVHINGENGLIFTWQVDASAPENAVLGKYIKKSRALWNRYQEILIERNRLPYKMKQEQLAAETQRLMREQDSLMILTAANDLRIMQKSKVDEIWLEMFMNNANHVKHINDFPYTEEFSQLYNRLTAEQQTHLYAREAHAALFAPQHPKNRVNSDSELFDIDGNKHTLSELQGRYVLLDFWGKGCGPCIEALPELGMLADMYKDKLSVVSISLDTDEIWRAALKTHPITWHNWSDGKGENGIFSHYGKGGIPLFVLISPDGNILDLWRGYGQGTLIDRLKGVIE